MTRETLNQKIYVVIDGEVEEMSYQEYLKEYGIDETTTPNGLGDRMHIREVEEGNVIEWQIWSWGTCGNHPRFTGTSFDNAEDAELYYYERCEWYIQEKNWNAPSFFYTEKEAEDHIIHDISDVNRIDLGVAAHIRRKQIIVKKERATREAAHRAKITAEYEARKAYLATAVPAEAATFVIDEKFIRDLKEAKNLIKQDKNNRHASALKGLIERNGKEKIESDFWQVFRILKAKAGI